MDYRSIDDRTKNFKQSIWNLMDKESSDYNPWADILKLTKANIQKTISYNEFAHGKEADVNHILESDNKNLTCNFDSATINRSTSFLHDINLIEEFDIDKLIKLHKYYIINKDPSHAKII